MTSVAAVEEPSLRMGSARGRWVLVATVLGSGVVLLDATVVNVALGRIGEDLDAGFSGLQWTVNAYTLTLASFILLGGSLGDRFGRRRVFVVGVVWFAAASMLCGLAPNIGTLVVARALQGVGGALLTPGSLAIISASFHKDDRAAAIGAWSGLGGIAAAVGPLVGGVLVEWSWRLVFVLNVPVAVVAVLIAARHVPESRDPSASDRFDLAGTALGAGGLAAVTYALTRAGDVGAAGEVLAIGGAGLVALAAFVGVEARSRHPLVPLVAVPERAVQRGQRRHLPGVRRPRRAVRDAGAPAPGGRRLVAVEVRCGDPPGHLAHAAVLRSCRCVGATDRAAAPDGRGRLVAAIGVLWMTAIDADASYLRDVLPPVLVFGAGLALLVAPLTATVLGAAEDRYAGIASGVNNAVARTAALIAVAVIPVAAGIGGDDYADPAAFGDGYRTAMEINAALLLLGAACAAAFIRRPAIAVEAPVESEDRVHVEVCVHCGVAGPQLHPECHAGGVSLSSAGSPPASP